LRQSDEIPHPQHFAANAAAANRVLAHIEVAPESNGGFSIHVVVVTNDRLKETTSNAPGGFDYRGYPGRITAHIGELRLAEYGFEVLVNPQEFFTSSFDEPILTVD
jgi:hypothetical protein